MSTSVLLYSYIIKGFFFPELGNTDQELLGSFIIFISASVETNGIIISGNIDLYFFFLHSTKASKIAVHCIW